jgi:hypothetical protein
MEIATKKPLTWHLKQAMSLAGQLPDNQDDARIILEQMGVLLETYLSKSEPSEPLRASNVLPFTG